MNPEQRLEALLRLKRYERPPDGYHEAFLREFRRRQRAALLKPRPWAVAWQRVAGLWPALEVPRFAYAAIAVAAIAVATVILRTPAPTGSLATRAELVGLPDFSLVQRPVTIGETLPISSRSAAAARHYVLQPLPASNDQPLSF